VAAIYKINSREVCRAPNCAFIGDVVYYSDATLPPCPRCNTPFVPRKSKFNYSSPGTACAVGGLIKLGGAEYTLAQVDAKLDALSEQHGRAYTVGNLRTEAADDVAHAHYTRQRRQGWTESDVIDHRRSEESKAAQAAARGERYKATPFAIAAGISQRPG
jgi:hypothetical protein